jgi:hypothetical protein
VFEQNPLALTAANEWTEPSGSNSNAKGKEKDKHQEAKTPITNRQITKLIEMNPITITQVSTVKKETTLFWSLMLKIMGKVEELKLS